MKSDITNNRKPKLVHRILMRLGLLAALCIAYPAVIVLLRFENYYLLPNGAVLDRVFDWKKWSRIDLLRSWDGEPLVRDVEFVCFNRKAVEVISLTSGGFVWLGGSGPLIPRGDAAHDDALRESGLDGVDGRCLGYFGSYLGAELLLSLPEFDWRRATPDQKPRASAAPPPERATR